MKLNLTKASSVQSVLIYGAPKSGKTQIVGDLSSEFNLIWFDLEHGSDTLRKLPQEQQDRIDLISLPDTRSYPIAIETCLKVIKGNECFIDINTGKVQPSAAIAKTKPELYDRICLNEVTKDTVVVFDSLTQLTNSAISNITKGKPDDYKLEYDDWGNLGKLMDIFLSHVQQAPFNVVCISHETEAQLVDKTMKIVPTAGTRNFSRNSAKYFGHVIHAELKNKSHRFSSSTTGSLNIVSGSRTDVALEKMETASLIPIFKSTTQSPQSNGQVAASQLIKKVTPTP